MKQHSLIEGSISKGILFFAIPLFFSYLFQTLYNTIDTILIGHYLGDLSLAAIGSTTAVFDLIIGFANGVGIGFGIVVARYFGSKDEDGLKRSVASSLVLGLLISLTLTILAQFGLPSLLQLLNTPSNIYNEALSYIRFIAQFVTITMFYNLGAGLLRAIGDSITPLIVLFFASILNIGLDIFCITQLNMGIVGAAFATIIAQGVSLLFCIILIIFKAKLLIPTRKHFVYDHELVMDLLGQGFSMGFMHSIVSIGTVTLQYAINSLGTTIITAHVTARKMLSIFNLVIMTLASSLSTFVSQNKGAKQKDRIIKGVSFCNKFGACYALFLTVLIFFTSKLFIQWLGGSSNPKVINTGALYLNTNIPCLIVLVYLCNYRNALQGLGKKVVPLISSVIELIGKIIFTMILIPFLKYYGVCLCEPIIWIIMTIQLYFSWKKAISELEFN